MLFDMPQLKLKYILARDKAFYILTKAKLKSINLIILKLKLLTKFHLMIILVDLIVYCFLPIKPNNIPRPTSL